MTRSDWRADWKADEIAALRETLEERDETIRQLRAALTPRFNVPVEWQMSQAQIAIFWLLLMRDIVTLDDMISGTRESPSARDGDGVSPSTIAVQLTRIRKKTAGAGVTIRNFKGLGWSLADREQWRERLGAARRVDAFDRTHSAGVLTDSKSQIDPSKTAFDRMRGAGVMVDSKSHVERSEAQDLEQGE